MFKRAEIALTALFVVLAAALLAAMALRIQGALSGRVTRVPILDPRVGIAYRIGKLVLAGSLLLLAPGVIYALSVSFMYTAVVRDYAKALLYGLLCAWALLEAGLCFWVPLRLLEGLWFRPLAFWAAVALCLPGAGFLTWLIAKSLPFPPLNACLVLDLPVRGVWLAGHAGATRFTNVHKTFPYAVDLLKLDPEGRLVDGDDRVVENWHAYGEPVYAPADGQVVEAVDGLPCRPIGEGDQVHPGGNHVLIAIDVAADVDGDSRQVMLAHLVAGSVAVEEGAYVTSGALLGRVGNSGNSEVPHLHLHVQSASGATFPFRFRSMRRKRWFFWRRVSNGYLIRNDRLKGANHS